VETVFEGKIAVLRCISQDQLQLERFADRHDVIRGEAWPDALSAVSAG